MIYGRELECYPYNLKAVITRCLVAGRRLVFGRRRMIFSNHLPLEINAAGEDANRLIRTLLESDGPCLIARFGSGEAEATIRGIDVQADGGILAKLLKMAIGRSGPFWWDNSIRAGLVWNAGFFPETNEALNAFSRRMCKDAAAIDILASWLPGERQIIGICGDISKVRGIPQDDLVPFAYKEPWTGTLKGKKVLVINPFSDTIKAQYGKREKLFKNPEMLPECELQTYRAISSFAGNKVPYRTWFEALDKMCRDVAAMDFDIALIGAGAYGMSLGAFIKERLGKKAVHMGGVVQLLFGIKGGRWDKMDYYATQIYNEHWVRPFASDTVANSQTIENGCYW